MLKLTHPENGDKILQLLVAYGRYSGTLLSVSGRATSHWPLHVVYPCKTIIRKNHWALIFSDLMSNRKYDLEVLDHKGEVAASASDLKVRNEPQDLTIIHPNKDSGPHGCGFMPYGATGQSGEPLRCVKLCPTNECGEGTIDGQVEFNSNGYWSVSFPNAVQGTYILKVSHESDCDGGDQVENLLVESC